MFGQVAKVVSLSASVVAGALSLWLTFVPESKSTILAPYIAAALVVAAVAGWRQLRLRPDWGWLPLGVAVVLLLPTTIIARAFGSVDMLALVFHVEFGTEGAGLGGLEREIAVAAFVAVSTFFAVIMFTRVSGWRWVTWLAAVSVLVANPLMRGAVVMAMPGLAGPQVSLMEHYVEPAIVPDAGAPRPDVVIVYLEGMDRIFMDTERFGEAMERLVALAGPGTIDMTGVGPMIGTGWSAAGMAASQCGVPVMPNGLRFGLNFEEQDRFMTGVTCLGDVLARPGYRTEFLVGGGVDFGGVDHFYDSHAVTDQIGIGEIAAMVPPEAFEAANLGWVVDDQMLLDVSLERHAELTSGDASALLIVETSGPHGLDVWMSRRCTESGRAEVMFDNAAGVKCTGDLVADFVETLRKAPDARPTLFVLLSDHINHNPDLKLTDPIETRRNLAMLIPPVAGEVAGPVRVIDREAAMIDLFPTILDVLGLIEPGGGAGLGVSLLGDAPTLVERYGRAEADRLLARDATLAARLWQ